MKKITELVFDNTYRRLPEDFYQVVDPTPFKKPFFIATNNEAGKLIDLDFDENTNNELLNFLSGKKIIDGEQPIAMYYTGHQFGVYNKNIGDGRAILLGEIRNKKNQIWDLHLKGAGRTRYSRQFDGRAVLRSTIREYLASEALFHLGIPTTRALCIIGGNEEILREKPEPGAMLIRMAESHVRFGSFECFYYNNQPENIKLLADYLISNHYKYLENSTDKYKLLVLKFSESTAKLVANWQAYGFTHGVLNTDNMSVLGLTLDYGPFGFMEEYDPYYKPNHSDHFGRYNFQNQPSIVYWNLQKLMQALRPIITNEEGLEALELYKRIYLNSYYDIMSQKLGLQSVDKGNKKFIDKTLNLLETFEIDYTIFFRNLSFFETTTKFNNKFLQRLSVSSPDLNNWFKEYESKIGNTALSNNKRMNEMDKINPKYILRNYICEKVIREAEDNNNYKDIEVVRKLFTRPFDEQPEFEEYAKESPKWAKNLIVSCSS